MLAPRHGLYGAWGSDYGGSVLIQAPSPVVYMIQGCAYSQPLQGALAPLPPAWPPSPSSTTATSTPFPPAWPPSLAATVGAKAPLPPDRSPGTAPSHGVLGERRQEPIRLLLSVLLPPAEDAPAPASPGAAAKAPRDRRPAPSAGGGRGGRSRSSARVRFDLGASTVHEVTPYEETYGVHPRDFVFDRRFCMIPVSLDGTPMDLLNPECADSDDDLFGPA